MNKNISDIKDKNNRKKSGPVILSAAVMILLVLLDQLTKYAALQHLKGKPPVSILPGILELVYVENSGISFGLFQDSAVIISLFSILWIGIMIYFLCRIQRRGGHILLCAGLVMAISGAAGNLIDRIRFHFVLDFIYLSFIHFPVFNVADILVVSGMILLAFLILFIYQEDDLHAL